MKRTYILYNESNEYIANHLRGEYFFNKKIYSKDLTIDEEILKEMCSFIGTAFYVIRPTEELSFSNFDFSFEPQEWDRKYVHYWNGDTTVRLYDKGSVESNLSLYTDQAMHDGSMPMKEMLGKIWDTVEFDIVFLSYDEPYADENFNKLKARFPRAKRVNKVKGILEAHKAAARLATSSMFYVVDADAEMMADFDFSFVPHSVDRETVHVWHSRNPVNGLEYGYGGVKLFPRKMLLEYKGSPVDFTTSVSGSLKVMEEISNVTKFNVDPFSTWRSAFRECAKLASKIIHNQDNTETDYRLDVWCNTADGEFGDFAVMGAIEGKQFGLENVNKPEMLRLVNDFDWLEKKFSS
jgi:hypothetical protein